MNTELLRKIADAIELNPAIYNQHEWSSDGVDNASSIPYVSPDSVGECGTRGCIAGWAVHLTPVAERPSSGSVAEIARVLLGIGEKEADVLFSGSWHPTPGRTVPEELRRIADQQSVWETATAGDYGTATAGRYGTATAGDYGTATAGRYGTATAGYGGTATAGDYGTATAGRYGTATAGYGGTATAGDRGTATAGYRGTATAGDRGTATAGYRGTATAGYGGTATAGDRGTATAGYRGTATAGDSGIVVIYRSIRGIRRPVVGTVGETPDAAGSPLVPGKAYKLDADGKFIPQKGA